MSEISEETGRDEIKDIVIKTIEKHIANQEYLFENELSFKEEEHQAIINELNDLLEEVRRL